jgi:glycosyltransferase involved in cell wall biosynthesis
MRIALVSTTFPPYMAGTGNVCYHNAMELARRGHQVSVFTSTNPSGGWLDPPEFAVHRLRAVFRIGNVALLPGLLQIHNVDLIHLHYPCIFGAEMVWMVSKLRRIPYVVTYHNDLIGKGFRKYLFDAYLKLFSGMVLRGARKIAVVSIDHGRSSKLAPLFQKRGKDVVEIPNGVDIDLFRPSGKGAAIRRRFGIGSEKKVILFVGALDQAHYFKGLDNLLQAFAKIISEETYLMIVGEGEWKNRYKKQAADWEVETHTIFPGHVTDSELPDFYNSADLAVLPSVTLESFGLVLVEAMACEKPVIASDLPGTRAVVSAGKDGLLVPPSDINALAEKIQYLLDNPHLRQEMGRRGRVKVEAKYAWPGIAARLIRMYEEVLNQRDIP